MLDYTTEQRWRFGYGDFNMAQPSRACHPVRFSSRNWSNVQLELRATAMAVRIANGLLGYELLCRYALSRVQISNAMSA